MVSGFYLCLRLETNAGGVSAKPFLANEQTMQRARSHRNKSNAEEMRDSDKAQGCSKKGGRRHGSEDGLIAPSLLTLKAGKSGVGKK